MRKIRAQNIMRNNQLLQRLRVSALALRVHNAGAKSKGDGSQESGSLYDPDTEGSEQEEVSKASQVAKDVCNNISNHIGNISASSPSRHEDQIRFANEELVGLRQELQTIKLQAQEYEAVMAKQSHEIESLKKTTQELSAFLCQLITFNHG